jgi:hypothetical protein
MPRLPPTAIDRPLRPKATGSLRSTAHRLQPLPNDLVDLEKLGATPVDAHCFALEQIALVVAVVVRVGLNALGVTGRDEAITTLMSIRLQEAARP